MSRSSSSGGLRQLPLRRLSQAQQGFRLNFRTSSLLVLLIFFAFIWILFRDFHVATSRNEATKAHSDHEQSFQAVFKEHSEEIQASIRQNWSWFKQYLLRLRSTSQAHASKPHDEEEDEVAATLRLDIHPEERKLRGGSSRKESFSDAALNNLDMPMRKVHGKMEPCLALLPEDEMSRLELPPAKPDEIQRLRYYHLDEDAIEIEETGGTLALDMFAGKQTMGERAESYKVQDAMEVHCGFAGKNTGFDLSARDQKHLKRCKVAVVTAAFGGGDTLAQPIGMSKASLAKVCFVAFWDEITLRAQHAEGNIPDPETGYLGLWRIVVVRNLPFSDQRRNGKIPKILTHRLLPSARYSIWVDSKYQFRRDPMGVLEALLWRNDTVFAISEHGARNCIYAEGEAIVAKHKATPEEVAVQLNQYRAEGLPLNATFNGHKALAEASVIVREHTSLTNLFMCLWFNEMVRFTARDQLSFGYVLRRLGTLKPYMFPVCTRRALVNKLGHKRKAKPLHRT